MNYYFWVKKDTSFLPHLPPIVVVEVTNTASAVAFEEAFPEGVLSSEDERGYSYLYGQDLYKLFLEAQDYYANWAELTRLVGHPYDWVSEILFREKFLIVQPPEGMSHRFFDSLQMGDLVQVGGPYLTAGASQALRRQSGQWLQVGVQNLRGYRNLLVPGSPDFVPGNCYQPQNLRAHLLRDGKLIRDI